MHYIRLLKPPRFFAGAGNRPRSVSTLITVTSDLGDYFLLRDTTITAELLQEVGASECKLATMQYQWRTGMRDLKIEFRFTSSQAIPSGAVYLVVSGAVGGTPADDICQLTSSNLDVLSAYSPPFRLIDGEEAERFVQRRLSIGHDKTLRIWEETGESIARHIW